MKPKQSLCRYRLVALDLDGTLMGRDLVISPRTKAAVQSLMDQRVWVTLATGRMFRATVPFAQELGINTPLICYQGALVKDPITGKVLFHRTIPLALAHQVVEEVQKRGLHVNVYIDDELYVAKANAWAERYATLSRVQLHEVGDLLKFLSQEPTKLVIVTEETQTDWVVEEFRGVFGASLQIMKSYPLFCEIAHPGCGKGKALEILAQHLGVAQEHTAAIGDNANDLDMLTWSGYSIAMADSSPEVLAAADFVTGTLEEDGAARALEQLACGAI